MHHTIRAVFQIELTWSSSIHDYGDLPPRNIRFDNLHHCHGALVDVDESAIKDLPHPQHLYHLQHFGTDTLDATQGRRNTFNVKTGTLSILYLFTSPISYLFHITIR